MLRPETMYRWCRRGLGEKYQPRSTICRGLISVAPWVDAVLLIIFFLLLANRLVLRAGVVVEMPSTGTLSGTIRGFTAVVLSHESPDAGSREEMVFFDDDPFAVKDRSKMLELRDRFEKAAREHPDTPLVLEADVNVRYGTIVTLCNMAQEAGIKEVNFAQRFFEGGTRDQN